MPKENPPEKRLLSERVTPRTLAKSRLIRFEYASPARNVGIGWLEEGLVLAVELKELNIMKRPPRSSDAPILSPELVIRILIVGTLILIGAFGLYEWELSRGATLAAARTVAVNTVIAIEIFYLFNCRSLRESMFRLGVLSNRWVVVGVGAMVLLQLLFTYVPAMNRFLMSEPIDLAAWVRILAAGLVGYLIVEFEKWLRRRRANA